MDEDCILVVAGEIGLQKTAGALQIYVERLYGVLVICNLHQPKTEAFCVGTLCRVFLDGTLWE